MTAAEDSKVKIWSQQGELQCSLGDTRYPVTCISINSDDLLVVGDCGGAVRLYQIMTSAQVSLVTMIDVSALMSRHRPDDADQARPGCDVLSLKLLNTARNNSVEDNDDLPSLVSCKTRVTEEILNTCQRCLVATTLGVCVLDLRSRSALEILLFSELSSPSSTILSSVASRAAISMSRSSVVTIYQTSLDNKCKLLSLTKEEKKSDTSEEVSDTDSGCCVVSLEDGDEDHLDNEDVVSVIPRSDIIKGSILDFNHKSSEMNKQSLTIIRAGSLPLEKMRTNIKLWQSSSNKSVKSSGYGRDKPRAKMFEPSVNKGRPRPRKNTLFTVSRSESDLSSASLVTTDLNSDSPVTKDHNTVTGARRQRWSVESAPASLSKSSSLLQLISDHCSSSAPVNQCDSSVRLWSDCSRSHLSHSPGHGRHLAVSGARNSVQAMIRR